MRRAEPAGGPSLTVPTGAPGSRWTVPLLGAAWLASLAGLLSVPLDLYDECLLLVGGRAVRAGELPYRDFYTHYGPLGYELISWFLPLGNPGIAYRLAQGFVLLLLAILIIFVSRALRPEGGAWTAAAAAVSFLGFATAIQAPHFFAYFFVLAGIGLFALGARAAISAASTRFDAAAGASFALAGMVRPAFGFYAAAAAIGLIAATTPRGGLRRIAVLTVAAVGTGALVWVLFFRAIPLEEAYLASIVIPGEISLHSSRFVPPTLQLSALRIGPRAWIAALTLGSAFALAVLGALFSASRGSRALGITGTALAAILPFALGGARPPGWLPTAGSAALFVLAVATWAFAREWVSKSGRRLASALCGATAAAFFHYYVSRADFAHLLPALALAVAAGLLVLPDPGTAGRVVTLLLVVVATRSPALGLEVSPPSQIGRAGRTASVSTASGFWRRWAASTFPVEAVEAVRAADREADPSSRFVALASDHRSSEGSAVVLFLLSSRLPYTKWYAYDPGVQNSAFVQQRMADELEKSGSRSAVVWSTISFGGRERGPDEPATAALDRRLLELYPVAAARFGGLLVRLR